MKKSNNANCTYSSKAHCQSLNNMDSTVVFNSDTNINSLDSYVNISDPSLLLTSPHNIDKTNNGDIVNNDSIVHTIVDPFSETLVPCSTSLVLSDTDSTSSQTANNSTVKDNTLNDLSTPFWIKLMMLQLSNALACVHSKRMIHMDVKPENILVKIVKEDIIFQLCDFNIFRIGEGSFVLDGDKVYMAPEILKNRCFFKSDVYSLGLVYLELVNDTTLPTSGEEYRKLRKNDFEGWRIDEIGRRMLEKNPSVRCSAKEVEDYFHNLLANSDNTG
ncbi:WEE protein kinase [Vittaforma corneae ATCC 50505]|uniref:WEE protein kinase n=1 Tax=Vittaforma corneae (strain ATCC 50505) TaxID=993615 RepID=L2GPI4_VITCO|nr:WEE protein kinase [Vittaforma corneae ATCC 50505]ELA42524.1 WEE protein kinase [Vittaforma corneae ATCC 50505]